MIRALVLLALACCAWAAPADAYHSVTTSGFGGFADSSCQPCVWATLDWIVPQASLDAGGAFGGGGQGVADWVGLDRGLTGFGNLAQTGTTSFITSGGVRSYDAWTDFYPAQSISHFDAGLYPVFAGDHMHGDVHCTLNCNVSSNTNMTVIFTLTNLTQNWVATRTIPSVQVGLGDAQYINEFFGSSTPTFPPVRFWSPQQATYGAGSLTPAPINMLSDGWAGYILGSDTQYRWQSPSHPFGPNGDNFNVCRSLAATLTNTAIGVPQCEASTYSGSSGLGGR